MVLPLWATPAHVLVKRLLRGNIMPRTAKPLGVAAVRTVISLNLILYTFRHGRWPPRKSLTT